MKQNNIKIWNIFNYDSGIDYALPYQFGFQPSASPIMHGIISLHHFAMFYIIFILCFVFSMLYVILETFTIREITNTEVQNFQKIKALYNIVLTHHSFLEILWVLIPSAILLSIAYPSFVLLYSMEYFVDSNVTLKVIGHQWYWSYEVVEGIETKQNGMYKIALTKSFDSYMVETVDLKRKQLRLLSTTAPIILPVRTYVRVLVTADDVIHSWAVPSLGVKIDAVPGRLNETFIYIDRVGHFFGQCSEFCGVKHGFMPIEIYAVEIKAFKRYIRYSGEIIKLKKKPLTTGEILSFWAGKIREVLAEKEAKEAEAKRVVKPVKRYYAIQKKFW